MPLEKFQKYRIHLVFYAGLIIHLLMNIYTAANLGVHFDEAYYWLYSQYPEWGFFDHPPMAAWFILLGQTFFKGIIGLRIVTLISSTLSILLIWEMVKRYKPDPILFWSVVYSMILIHPYSFIATPDAPLFFFTVLFFYFYRQYIQKSNWCNVILVAFSIALMLYSKYHGILVVGFTVLSNLKLLKKWTFWIIVLLTLVYLSPHFFWQIHNDFPTLQYHLVDSHKTGFSLKVVLEYVISQVLVSGPFLGWLFLYAMWKTPNTEAWERGLKITGIGTFLFFFLTTFSGDFEAHWTLIAFVPMIILSYKYLQEHPRWQKWVKIAALVNFTLLLVTRILITTPAGENIKAFKLYFGWDKSSQELKQYAGEYPVVFQDAWNMAARYAYYTNDKSISNLNSAYHRPNQFDLWHLEEDLFGQTVYLVSRTPYQFNGCDSLVTDKITWYGKKIEKFRCYYKLDFKLDSMHWEGNNLHITTTLKNNYEEMIVLDPEETPAYFQVVIPKKRKFEVISQTPAGLLEIPVKGDLQTSSILTFPETFDLKKARLVLKIGELNPIPMRYEVIRKPD